MSYRNTTASVNLKSIKHNFEIARKLTNKSGLIIPMVKADAYGHGSLKVAERLTEPDSIDGIMGLGVASLEEGQILRKHLNFLGRRDVNIYVFSAPQDFDKEMSDFIIHNKLIPVIHTMHGLKIIQKNSLSFPFHLKFNTGMNRLGIAPNDVGEAYDILKKNSKINVKGILTHLAASEELKTSKSQLDNFEEIYRKFSIIDRIKYFHFSNSGAIINQFHKKYSFCNLFRPGLLIYGYSPDENMKINLKPAMELSCNVISVNKIKKGTKVGYSGAYTAPKDMTVAVLSMGYGDGLNRHVSMADAIVLNGKKRKIIGRVSMDLITVEVPKDEKIHLGAKGFLLGPFNTKKKGQSINAWDMAKILNTIPYEVTTCLMPRVERVYIDE